MSDLAPCPTCKRHVRIDAASCPFCAATLAALRGRNVIPRAFTRAAVFSAALAGCSDHKKAPNPTAGSAIGSAATGGDVTPAPPPIDAAEPAVASGSGAAADASVADAVESDAGAAAGAGVDRAKQLKRKVVKPQSGELKRDPNAVKMPYGAPPTRRRIV